MVIYVILYNMKVLDLMIEHTIILLVDLRECPWHRDIERYDFLLYNVGAAFF
jgi:hypothetical protein